MMTNTNQSHNAAFAKLLAEENIRVRIDSRITTAKMDVVRRILYIPNWIDISPDLHKMLVIHEVGHALYTPGDEWSALGDHIDQRYLDAFRNYVNVTEDVRIDRLQKNRFLGAPAIYNAGAEELWNRDFFGLGKKNISFDSLPLIDRINCFYKGGITKNIPFSESERVLVDAAFKTKTFADARDLAKEIFFLTKQSPNTVQVKGEKSVTKPGDGAPQPVLPPVSEEALEELTAALDDFFAVMEEKKESALDDMAKEEIQKMIDKAREEYKTLTVDDLQAMTEDAEEIAASIEAPDNDTEDDSEPKEDPLKDFDLSGTWVPPAPVTQTAMDKELDKLAVSQDNREIQYVVDTPKELQARYVDDYKDVLQNWRTEWNKTSPEWRASIARKFNEFKTEESGNIAFMMKEFQLKKAAEEYSKTIIRKSGKLDMNKMHSYSYNDDIFKRSVIATTGKNHGLILLLDWSGSMSPVTFNAIKQLISLSIFCKRLNIPFDFYIFRESGNKDEFFTAPTKDKDETLYRITGHVKVRNILSSRMDLADYTFACHALWSLGIGGGGGLLRGIDPQNGTPLNPALYLMAEIVRDFKRKNGVEVVTFMCVTDGEDSSYESQSYTLQSYGEEYRISLGFGVQRVSTTKEFLRRIKHVTDANMIGYYMCSSHFIGVVQTQAQLYGAMESRTEITNQAKESGFVTLTGENMGYDDYIIMKTKNLEMVDISEAISKIEKEQTFKKQLRTVVDAGQRMVDNRLFLRKLIARMTA